MTDPAEELVVHKATRECPMVEPHPRKICGLVKAREERQHHPPRS